MPFMFPPASSNAADNESVGSDEQDPFADPVVDPFLDPVVDPFADPPESAEDADTVVNSAIPRLVPSAAAASFQQPSRFFNLRNTEDRVHRYGSPINDEDASEVVVMEIPYNPDQTTEEVLEAILGALNEDTMAVPSPPATESDKSWPPLKSDDGEIIYSWKEYIAFCKQYSPKVGLVFPHAKDNNGHITHWVAAFYPQKILCDFSAYFKTMFCPDHDWLESRTRMAKLDDVTLDDFQRLYTLLKAGWQGLDPRSPAQLAYNNGADAMPQLMRLHRLTARFLMPSAREWVRRAIEAVIAHNMRCWPREYLRDVVDIRLSRRASSSSSEALRVMHADKALGMIRAYMVMKREMSERERPVRLDQIMAFFVETMPHALVAPLVRVNALDAEFVREFLWTKLATIPEMEAAALAPLG